MWWRKGEVHWSEKAWHLLAAVWKHYNEQFLKVEGGLIFPLWQHYYHFLSPYLCIRSHLCLKFSPHLTVLLTSFHSIKPTLLPLRSFTWMVSRKWQSLSSGTSNQLRAKYMQHDTDNLGIIAITILWSQGMFFNHLYCISIHNSGSHGRCSIYSSWINTEGIH